MGVWSAKPGRGAMGGPPRPAFRWNGRRTGPVQGRPARSINSNPEHADHAKGLRKASRTGFEGAPADGRGDPAQSGHGPRREDGPRTRFPAGRLPRRSEPHPPGCQAEARHGELGMAVHGRPAPFGHLGLDGDDSIAGGSAPHECGRPVPEPRQGHGKKGKKQQESAQWSYLMAKGRPGEPVCNVQYSCRLWGRLNVINYSVSVQVPLLRPWSFWENHSLRSLFFPKRIGLTHSG